nr:endo alpha-1,4 polygalactosaminidase [Microbacterium halimionae]
MLISGCAAATDTAGAITLPPSDGLFDYQLGGGYDPGEDVTVVTRDSTDEPADGRYSICYVNGFQTQPGAEWPEALILQDANGTPVADPGWPDEYLLDISTPEKRTEAAAQQGAIIERCADSGFQAVEFDNLDSWTRSEGALTEADAVAFATVLVDTAHDQGLAASQKNSAEMTAVGKNDIGFDFVTVEECDLFDECDEFMRAYGEQVFDIEYTDDFRGTFAEVCARAATPARTILRDRDLVTPDNPAYVYEHC